MDGVYWIVPVVAIVAGITYAIMRNKYAAQVKMAPMVEPDAYRRISEENISTNRQVLAHLQAMEQRLGAVEKTLTDIH